MRARPRTSCLAPDLLLKMLIALVFSHLVTLSHASETVPFSSPINKHHPLGIFRRDSKCGVSCSSMGADVCCGKQSVCALDQTGNVACCPFNAVCTGHIAAGSTPTPTTAPTNPTPGTAISHAISGSSTISNPYYPFPILPTPFANEAVCSTAYSLCQAESAKCTGFVGGGGYGVTIAGQNGQITQQAAMPASSAESICASLSKEACHDLQPSQCPTLGIVKGASTDGGFTIDKSSTSWANLDKHVRWGSIGLVVTAIVACLL